VLTSLSFIVVRERSGLMGTARGVLQSVTEASRAGTGNISNRSRRGPETLVIAFQLWLFAVFI